MNINESRDDERYRLASPQSYDKKWLTIMMQRWQQPQRLLLPTLDKVERVEFDSVY